MIDARLKSLAERINRLMDERDAIGSDIRDIYSEAKSAGYIPKALRKTIARMRADQSDLAEQDTLVQLYEAALGRVGKAMAAVRAGATLDAAAEANGIHRATLARARAVAKSSKNATPAHDNETGEITETAKPDTRSLGSDEGTAENEAASALVAAEHSAPQGTQALRPPTTEAGVRPATVKPAPDGGVGAGTISDEQAAEAMEYARIKLEVLRRIKAAA